MAASSTESGAFPAAAVVDGDTGTRWSSAFSDPQWVRIDLGESRSISQVVLNWEAAYATGYHLDVSNDGNSWTTIYSTTTGKGGTETLGVSGKGRYIRFTGTKRATGYGYSLWEFQVFGSVDSSSTTPRCCPRRRRHPGRRASSRCRRPPTTRWSRTPGVPP